MDAYLLLAGAALGFAGAAVLFVLRPSVGTAGTAGDPRVGDPQDGSPGHPRHGRSLRRPAPGVVDEATDDGEDAAAPGTYAHLAAAVAELRHSFKLLQNEWTDKESRMDALIKRAWRLHKIAGGPPADDPPSSPPVPLSAAEQRAQIVRKFRGGE